MRCFALLLLFGFPIQARECEELIAEITQHSEGRLSEIGKRSFDFWVSTVRARIANPEMSESELPFAVPLVGSQDFSWVVDRILHEVETKVGPRTTGFSIPYAKTRNKVALRYIRNAREWQSSERQKRFKYLVEKIQTELKSRLKNPTYGDLLVAVAVWLKVKYSQVLDPAVSLYNLHQIGLRSIQDVDLAFSRQWDFVLELQSLFSMLIAEDERARLDARWLSRAVELRLRASGVHFYTPKELSIAEFLKTRFFLSYFKGLVDQPTRADGTLLDTRKFLEHDDFHTWSLIEADKPDAFEYQMNLTLRAVRRRQQLMNELLDRIDKELSPIEGAAAHLWLFMYGIHETPTEVKRASIFHILRLSHPHSMDNRLFEGDFGNEVPREVIYQTYHKVVRILEHLDFD